MLLCVKLFRDLQWDHLDDLVHQTPAFHLQTFYYTLKLNFLGFQWGRYDHYGS
jgi:hypothetical protein